MKRLPMVFSTLALLIALLGVTPLGTAARETVASVVPFAKVAGRANVADNAKRLNGRKSSTAGQPGTIPVVAANGKLPASLGVLGPQGPRGAKGDTGSKGDRGPNGVVNAYTKLVPENGVYSPITGATLVSLSLPAGRYVIFGRVLIANKTSLPRPDTFYALCTVAAGEDSDYAQVRSTGQGPIPVGVHVIHDFKTPGSVTLKCSGSGVGNESTWARARITAVQVASASP